ncbi:unnamed protein product [Nesidiocoris tenuis]|uniref:MIOS-like alpha-solenoid domain-containing protein n=1 Tax=Nesidiocoris tenuis TaxID=355587 RepID=A0A6H5FYR4_9HEMI|nr:unnamed protein product [Nesidiocoris tenuis]
MNVGDERFIKRTTVRDGVKIISNYEDFEKLEIGSAKLLRLTKNQNRNKKKHGQKVSKIKKVPRRMHTESIKRITEKRDGEISRKPARSVWYVHQKTHQRRSRRLCWRSEGGKLPNVGGSHPDPPRTPIRPKQPALPRPKLFMGSPLLHTPTLCWQATSNRKCLYGIYERLKNLSSRFYSRSPSQKYFGALRGVFWVWTRPPPVRYQPNRKLFLFHSTGQGATAMQKCIGYSNDNESVWRDACIASRLKLNDPYLRAVFAFLTADSDNYNSVLVSCCPNCRKPQPRCSICLINMGTPSQSDASNCNSNNGGMKGPPRVSGDRMHLQMPLLGRYKLHRLKPLKFPARIQKPISMELSYSPLIETKRFPTRLN